MLQYSALEVAALCGATRSALEAPNLKIHYVAFDSRQLTFADATLFVCLRTARNDGHAYITELIQKGVKHFLVADDYKHTQPGINFIYVPDTLRALQQFAKAHRMAHQLRVIAITGSNGKTIVKEWLARAVSYRYNVAKSPKSYNSQLGVPLSVLEIEPRHEIGIFEAGISKKGEMASLQAILKPELGILTNIGSAHDEGFDSRIEKLREKLLLFKESKYLIYNDLNDEYSAEIHNFCLKHRVTPLPWQWQGDLWCSQSNSLPFYLPSADPASKQNIGHCIAALVWLQTPLAEIQKHVASFKNIPMRLMLKPGIQGSYLIDDTYNNDLSGLKIALQFMELQQKHGLKYRTLICSEMEETGLSADELQKRITQLIEGFQIKHFIAIGMDAALDTLPNTRVKYSFYRSTDEFLKDLRNLDFSNQMILIKGARRFGFERIVQALEQKQHTTRLEVNLENLVHNLNCYRQLIGPQVKIMAMVKAMSYGTGTDEIAKMLQFHGVDYLAVAYADEGVRLRQSGIHLPIMVMSPSEEDFENLLLHQLEPEIYSFRLLQQFEQFLATRYPGRTGVLIHLKLDTGMKRLGFIANEVNALSARLHGHPQLKVASIFSHLAASESDSHQGFTLYQLQQFDDMSNKIIHALGYTCLRHILNSAGIIRYPQAHYDMVRLGLGLYGIDGSPDFAAKLKLVGTLKSVVLQTKDIAPGETVGYGRSQWLDNGGKIATIAIGYSDGFSRRLSNGRGQVKIKDKWFPTIGRVCMDMTMIDITGSDVQEGDEVIIFDDAASLQALAQALDTIPYEVLTSIGERVKRVFFWE